MTLSEIATDIIAKAESATDTEWAIGPAGSRFHRSKPFVGFRGESVNGATRKEPTKVVYGIVIPAGDNDNYINDINYIETVQPKRAVQLAQSFLKAHKILSVLLEARGDIPEPFLANMKEWLSKGE